MRLFSHDLLCNELCGRPCEFQIIAKHFLYYLTIDQRPETSLKKVIPLFVETRNQGALSVPFPGFVERPKDSGAGVKKSHHLKMFEETMNSTIILPP